jgi:hypothetical protein
VSDKIQFSKSKVPAIKNKAGLRGLKVCGSRVSEDGPWEVVLDVPFQFKPERGVLMMIWPAFELEPTRPGGWVRYHFITYNEKGVSSDGYTVDNPEMAYELPEELGPETNLYEWVCWNMHKRGMLPADHSYVRGLE